MRSGYQESRERFQHLRRVLISRMDHSFVVFLLIGCGKIDNDVRDRHNDVTDKDVAVNVLSSVGKAVKHRYIDSS